MPEPQNALDRSRSHFYDAKINAWAAEVDILGRLADDMMDLAAQFRRIELLSAPAGEAADALGAVYDKLSDAIHERRENCEANHEEEGWRHPIPGQADYDDACWAIVRRERAR